MKYSSCCICGYCLSVKVVLLFAVILTYLMNTYSFSVDRFILLCTLIFRIMHAILSSLHLMA